MTFITALANFAAFLFRLLRCTQHWEIEGLAHLDAVKSSPVIFAFWHEQQLLMSFFSRYTNRNRKIFTLISQHRDGRLIAETVKRFGIDSVAGSSTRGAVSAFMKLARVLETGSDISITPDGPRGPRRQVKSGVIELAACSGCPIVPLALEAESKWTFHKSWDQMILPKPFARVRVVVGAPVYISKELAENEQRGSELVRAQLQTVSAQAEKFDSNASDENSEYHVRS